MRACIGPRPAVVDLAVPPQDKKQFEPNDSSMARLCFGFVPSRGRKRLTNVDLSLGFLREPALFLLPRRRHRGVLKRDFPHDTRDAFGVDATR